MSDLPPPATPPPGQPGPQPGYPGTQPGQPGYPGAQPGPQPGYPGAQPGQPGYPGAQPGYPGTQPGWDPAGTGGPGTQPGWDPNPSTPWGPPGGYPPVPPSGGYPPAAAPYPGQTWYGGPVTGWYPPGVDPNDPLVTPPGVGLGGWWERCLGAVRRGWRVLLPLLLLTQVLPAVVLSVISVGVDPSARWDASIAQDPTSLPDTFVGDVTTLLLVTIVGSVLVGLVQCLGWAAGTWVIARQGAGEPVDLGTALRYGARRMLGLWGWTLLTGLIIAVGLCFCALPGIYLAAALSLFGPVYLFERENPLGRAWGMFHKRLGMVLGRVLLVVALVIVVSIVAGVVQAAGSAPFGLDPFGSAGTAIGVISVLVVTGVLALPAQLMQLVGLVVTYAEQRAQEGPVNSARLAAELG
ncbi:hypothetical protein [Micromonospora avicenniae]|uniref:Membrane domain of glycerophosphoryl diester phosphodiesterase n=1 Tax=Micromonospora avicenniae TaxID=1198245 RepID=A0A1N6QS98_9ACTN|nr:hypothetical protein [Micromonospora avicenniae]SIQ19464.1 hypothetical protein SAMN05444858_101458 [Micromonospora avicenniae]